jgi:hypothetical protein
MQGCCVKGVMVTMLCMYGMVGLVYVRAAIGAETAKAPRQIHIIACVNNY